MTAPVSVPLLDELEAARAAATPGVWKLWGMSVMADQDGTSNVDTAVGVAHTAYRDEHGKPRTFDAACIVAEHNAVPRLVAALRAAEDALTLIRRDGCENTTGQWTCLESGSGRTRDARYGADRWCDSCVAADALLRLASALAEEGL